MSRAQVIPLHSPRVRSHHLAYTASPQATIDRLNDILYMVRLGATRIDALEGLYDVGDSYPEDVIEARREHELAVHEFLREVALGYQVGKITLDAFPGIVRLIESKARGERLDGDDAETMRAIESGEVAA